jgi:hypothetical protein
MKDDTERLKRIIADRDTEIAILNEKVKVLTLENIKLINKQSRKNLDLSKPPKTPRLTPHPNPLPSGCSAPYGHFIPKGEKELEDEDA